MQDMRLKKLSEYEGEDRVISSIEMEEMLKEKPDSIINVKSLIPSLDNSIESFREGELYIISGPTKNGKTLFAQSLTASFVRQLYFPLWFSYEVPARQFLKSFPELPLFYMPKQMKASAISWFEDRVFESFQKYHTRIIFIDHLHYLVDLIKLRHPSIEIGQIIRRLKSMAVNNNFLIFLICHTTKGASEEDLSYESIRDSSLISQESDCVLMIKRIIKNGENYSNLRIEFHRRTGIFQKVIRLKKINGYLVEIQEGEIL